MTGGLFAILDDIAILLDDAAVMGKLAAKKTAGILGDDLAVNAEKATGFHASRELPVLWAISKGSLLNKLIILPLAFLLSAFAPWLIVPVLLLGGAYLSYEGFEKVFHAFSSKSHLKMTQKVARSENELAEAEKAKIRSAIRTDFILSIEIVIISLGTVIEHPLMLQVMVVSLIALLATVGVYGLVALLVRMDDIGFYLIAGAERLEGVMAKVVAWHGAVLVASLPKVVRALEVIGTMAMLIVGGGMYSHNIDAVHHVMAFLPALPGDLIIGLVLGALLLALQKGIAAAMRIR